MIIDYSVDIPGDATVSRALKIGKLAFPFSKSETGGNPCFMQGFFIFRLCLVDSGKVGTGLNGVAPRGCVNKPRPHIYFLYTVLGRRSIWRRGFLLPRFLPVRSVRRETGDWRLETGD